MSSTNNNNNNTINNGIRAVFDDKLLKKETKVICNPDTKYKQKGSWSMAVLVNDAPVDVYYVPATVAPNMRVFGHNVEPGWYIEGQDGAQYRIEAKNTKGNIFDLFIDGIGVCSEVNSKTIRIYGFYDNTFSNCKAFLFANAVDGNAENKDNPALGTITAKLYKEIKPPTPLQQLTRDKHSQVQLGKDTKQALGNPLSTKPGAPVKDPVESDVMQFHFGDLIGTLKIHYRSKSWLETAGIIPKLVENNYQHREGNGEQNENNKRARQEVDLIEGDKTGEKNAWQIFYHAKDTTVDHVSKDTVTSTKELISFLAGKYYIEDKKRYIKFGDADSVISTLQDYVPLNIIHTLHVYSPAIKQPKLE